MYDTKFDTEAKPTAKALQKFAKAANIADLLDDEELSRIGADVCQGYERDKESLGERFDRWDKATELAMQTIEQKNFPFESASNVKFPLMTTAAIQFNARAYPAIVNGGDIVKPKVIGKHDEHKLKAAMRAAEYMSWQLCEEMEEWEEDTDRLLVMLPILGTLFRKSWFSPIKKRPCSKLIKPQDLIVSRHAQSLETSARITERFHLFKNEILSNIRRGLYRDVDIGAVDGDEDNAQFEMLEQHCWLDLDEDGFREPYTVTVREGTGQVLRIAARYTEADVTVNQRGQVVDITPRHFYTKYGFIPSLDGCFYDVGFCDILYPMNEAVNTTINQLLDAATLQNNQTGFISKSLRIGSGRVRMRMGELMPVQATGDDIRRGIVLQQWPGPSPVLFSLLGLLIESGREISGVKDILTGEAQGANASPTTTLALIEQGMKAFTVIYKRIHRAMAKELRKLRDINFVNLNPQTYSEVLDEPVDPRDFDPSNYNFYPVSDPTVVTDMQRLGKANYLGQFANDPLINPVEIRKRMLEAAQIEDIEALLVPPSNQPTIEQQIELAKAERAKLELMLKVREAYRNDYKAEAETEKMKAETMKTLAETEATAINTELSVYQQQAEALYEPNSQQGGMGGMDAAPSNPGLPGIPGAGAASFQGDVGQGGFSVGQPDPYAPVDTGSVNQMSDPTGSFGPQF